MKLKYTENVCFMLGISFYLNQFISYQLTRYIIIKIYHTFIIRRVAVIGTIFIRFWFVLIRSQGLATLVQGSGQRYSGWSTLPS